MSINKPKSWRISPDLQDCVSALCEQARIADPEAAEPPAVAADRAIKAAFALGATKVLCDVPTWDAFLGHAGVSQNAARDLLDLHRVTLNARAVVDLGGVKAATAWAAGLHLPMEGEVLAVTVGPWSSARPDPISYVWPVGGGHCAGIVNFHDPSFQGRMTSTPTANERVVWQCVWTVLGPQHAEMDFHVIAGPDAELLVDALEVRRIAAFVAARA